MSLSAAVDLICGACRHRWRYVGDSPMQEFRDHSASAHPGRSLGPSPLEVREREPGEDDGDEEAAP